MRRKYLVVLRGELVETFLNDMVAVEVLDKHNNMGAERDNNGMNLNIVSLISLNSSVSLEEKRKSESDLPVVWWTGSQSFFVQHECHAC